MNKLTKHLSFATFLWVALVFSPQAMADYISLKEGAFQDLQFSDALHDAIYYKDRNGQLLEVDFNWGNKKTLQVTGGIQVDSNNQLANVFMGLTFEKDDQFIYRELHIKDRLYFSPARAPLTWTYAASPPDYLLSNVDATARELTYVFPGGDWFVKVGQSNIPVMITFPHDPGDSSSNLPGNMVAVNPRTNTLIFGVLNPFSYGMKVDDEHRFPLKKLIAAGKNGFITYFDQRVDLGIINQEVGQQIYSVDYGNTIKGTQKVDNVGIRGMKGTEILLTMGGELGTAYLFRFGGNTAVASIGLFAEFAGPLSGFFRVYHANNRTTNGTEWLPGGYGFYGINARVAIDF